MFPADLPVDGLRWPTNADGVPRCPVCDEASTRFVEIGTTSSGALGMVSPVSVQRVTTLRVPACDDHDDGVGFCGEATLTFRSFVYSKEFAALNAEAPQ